MGFENIPNAPRPETDEEKVGGEQRENEAEQRESLGTKLKALAAVSAGAVVLASLLPKPLDFRLPSEEEEEDNYIKEHGGRLNIALDAAAKTWKGLDTVEKFVDGNMGGGGSLSGMIGDFLKNRAGQKEQN